MSGVTGSPVSGSIGSPVGSPLSRAMAKALSPFRRRLVASLGGSYTFTRGDSDAVVIDFAGITIDVTADEARFSGARRVQNLLWTDFRDSSTNSFITKTLDQPDGAGGDTAMRLVRIGGGVDPLVTIADTNAAGVVERNSIDVKYIAGDNIVILEGGIGFGIMVPVTVPTDGAWHRISAPVSARFAAGKWGVGFPTSGAAGTEFLFRFPQQEDVTHQTDQNPAHHVSKGEGVNHGSNVDGVRYSTTENGNTVASNFVTEAIGTTIAEATLKGVLIEEQRTNYSDGSDDLSGGAETIDLTSAGTGDYTLSVSGTAAVTVAAGTATGTGFAQATAGSPVTFNISVVGTITLTLNSGALTVAPNGSVIKQVEKGSFLTSWIPTTSTAAVTRNAETLEYSANNYSETGSYVCAITVPDSDTGTVLDFGDAGAGLDYVKLHVVGGVLTATIFDGGATQAVISGSALTAGTYKVGLAWGTNDVRMYLDGAADGTPDPAAAMPATADITTFNIGCDSNDTDQLDGNLKDLKVYSKTLNAATMIGLTS